MENSGGTRADKRDKIVLSVGAEYFVQEGQR